MHILRTDLFSDLKGRKLNFLSFLIAFKRTIKLSLLVHVLFDATQRELTEGPVSEPENLAVFRDAAPQRNFPKTSSYPIFHTGRQFAVLHPVGSCGSTGFSLERMREGS